MRSPGGLVISSWLGLGRQFVELLRFCPRYQLPWAVTDLLKSSLFSFWELSSFLKAPNPPPIPTTHLSLFSEQDWGKSSCWGWRLFEDIGCLWVKCWSIGDDIFPSVVRGGLWNTLFKLGRFSWKTQFWCLTRRLQSPGVLVVVSRSLLVCLYSEHSVDWLTNVSWPHDNYCFSSGCRCYNGL